MYTVSFIVGNIIPKSIKCIHSATKIGFLDGFPAVFRSSEGSAFIVRAPSRNFPAAGSAGGWAGVPLLIGGL